jgi:L-rhamnose mutarotase
MWCCADIDLNFWLKAGGLVIGGLGVGLPFFQWVQTKRSEERDRRFKNYHEMIKVLVSPEVPGGTIWFDRQVAVLFELREYRQYHEVTERIVEGLLSKWKKELEQRQTMSGLVNEAELTLDFIRRSR